MKIMQWNAATGDDCIIHMATFYAFGDFLDHTASWTLSGMTAIANEEVHQISLDIWAATGIWEIDDKNQTDLPSATTSLVNGQPDYAIPGNWFKIQRIEIEGADGIWHILRPRELREIWDAIPNMVTPSGMPTDYTIRGNSIYLIPAPDNGVSVTLSSGMRIYFTRDFLGFNTPATYTTNDTTTPGFDTQFHDYLAKRMGRRWCLVNGPDSRVKNLTDLIAMDKAQLEQHYGVKWRDKKVGVRPRREIYI